MSTQVTARPVEEEALFNPGFLAVLLHHMAREHARRSDGEALPTVLTYLALPLALHGPTRRSLPANVTAQMGEWVRAHPEALVGLSARARALRPMVSTAVCFGLAHGVLSSTSEGVQAGTLQRRPRGMARSVEVDECIAKAGFLGRWFSEQADPTTTMALWGLRA